MNLSKSLLLAAVLAAAPLGTSSAGAQDRHHQDATQHREMNSDSDRGDRHGDRDRRDMRHDWRGHRGHHYGWRNGRGNWHRHCHYMWRHHHRVRICR